MLSGGLQKGVALTDPIGIGANVRTSHFIPKHRNERYEVISNLTYVFVIRRGNKVKTIRRSSRKREICSTGFEKFGLSSLRLQLLHDAFYVSEILNTEDKPTELENYWD